MLHNNPQQSTTIHNNQQQSTTINNRTNGIHQFAYQHQPTPPSALNSIIADPQTTLVHKGRQTPVVLLSTNTRREHNGSPRDRTRPRTIVQANKLSSSNDRNVPARSTLLPRRRGKDLECPYITSGQIQKCLFSFRLLYSNKHREAITRPSHFHRTCPSTSTSSISQYIYDTASHHAEAAVYIACTFVLFFAW
jgi:hypothetical protein